MIKVIDKLRTYIIVGYGESGLLKKIDLLECYTHLVKNVVVLIVKLRYIIIIITLYDYYIHIVNV